MYSSKPDYKLSVGFMSCGCHVSFYVLILCHAINWLDTMNVFSVVQAVNTASSSFMLPSII